MSVPPGNFSATAAMTKNTETRTERHRNPDRETLSVCISHGEAPRICGLPRHVGDGGGQNSGCLNSAKYPGIVFLHAAFTCPPAQLNVIHTKICRPAFCSQHLPRLRAPLCKSCRFRQWGSHKQTPKPTPHANRRVGVFAAQRAGLQGRE